MERNDAKETLEMIKILIDHIDDFYSVNNTLIRDVRPDSTRFVLEKAAGLIAAQVIREEIGCD